MVNVTLKYGANTLVVQCLSARGIYDVDDLRTWPGIDQVDLAGGRRQVVNSLARVITLQTAPITAKADRVFVGVGFNLSNVKQLVYGAETINVVWKNAQTPFQSTWVSGFEGARQYTLVFDEVATWTVAPTSFS